MKKFGLVFATTVLAQGLLTQTATAYDMGANLTLAAAQTTGNDSWKIEPKAKPETKSQQQVAIDKAMEAMNQDMSLKLEQQIAEMMDSQLTR